MPFRDRTALHEAISMSHTDVFRYLMHKSADASIQNDAMETPFQLAEKRGFDRDTLNLFFRKSFFGPMFPLEILAHIN